MSFHPIISMYYLAREKLERDRVYGPGLFASSQLSVAVDAANATAANMTTPTEDKSSRSNASSRPPAPGIAPSRKDSVTKAKADYSMPLPRLPAPETSHYSGMSYDTNTAAPSPTAPAFAVPQAPTPRARDPGAGLSSVPPSPTVASTAATAVATSPQAQAIPVRHVEIDQNATVGPKRGALPRAPPPSTHRRSHSMSQRPTMLAARWGGMFGGQHASSAVDENGKVIPEPPKTVGPDATTFPPISPLDDKDKNHDHTSPFTGGATLVRKFGSLLVGGGDGSRRYAPPKRGSILGGVAAPASDDEKAALSPALVETKDDEPSSISSDVTQRQTSPQMPTTIHTSPPSPTTPSIASSVPTRRSFVTQQFTNAHRRAATILDPQGRATRHERRSSTGGVAIMGNTVSSGTTSVGGITIGRTRRPSTGYSTASGKHLAERLFGPKTSEPVSTQGGEIELAEKKEEESADAQEYSGEMTDREEDDKGAVKPVFLKGLFRYVLFFGWNFS